MTLGQTTARFTGERSAEPVTSATGEKHDRALAVVQRLLAAERVRSRAVHTITLKLSQDGRPLSLAERGRHAPELVAYGDGGRMVATVTVGSRSGCYLVRLPVAGVAAQTVSADQPHAVVDLVLAATRGDGRGRT
ncbi:hypothetical protein [Streptosporangium sp. V21-05]|uniref:hypothetical protein n=1 Tax=Streptosporangium sp. V21-05 TaxID=3446115 RepID=UPI003F531217